ncbi:MAG: ferredoxin family protein [Bacteroidota bacterium]
MAKIKGTIVINTEKCKGCELCVLACPTSVIGISKNINNKGYHYAEPINDDCSGCASCAVICPDGVIAVYRTKTVVAV